MDSLKDRMFSKDYGAEESLVLCCAHCGGENLHQHCVEVFERVEDAKVGMHTLAGGSNVQVDCNLARNPSVRRDAVRLVFSCEQCEAHKLTYVEFIQHKGTTYVRFKKEEA